MFGPRLIAVIRTSKGSVDLSEAKAVTPTFLHNGDFRGAMINANTKRGFSNAFQ
jgi:hypothetical protein